jgi:hypothetical protein
MVTLALLFRPSTTPVIEELPTHAGELYSQSC